MAQSVYELFLQHVQERPGATAMLIKRGGTWKEVSWQQVHEQARKISAALLGEGMGPGDRVAIISHTRFEWLVADLGIMGAAAVTVPVYPSSMSPEATYVLTDSDCTVVFVEDPGQLSRLGEVKSQLPRVKRVVLMEGVPPSACLPWAVGWDDFLHQGEAILAQRPDALAQRLASLTRKNLLTLIYTSGTTGMPKGVMLDQDNGIYEAEALDACGIISRHDVQLLFLPMAHVFAKVIEMSWLKTGFVLALAESVDKLISNMAEVRPTVMCAVPRVYERIYTRVVGAGVSQSGIRGKLFKMAMEESEHAGWADSKRQTHGGLRWAAAEKLVFEPVGRRLKRLFGGRIRFFVSGGAPLSRKIAHFFRHVGISICEGYGLTESSGATCLNLPHNFRIGSVGPPLPGTEVRVDSTDEILIRGRGVMRGYWNNPGATSEVLDRDGWLHTGDMGEMDPDGYVTITDRKKEIIITAGGKNVAPQNLETALAANPFISHVMVHGDGRPFLTALFTLNQDAVHQWAAEKGVDTGTEPLSNHPAVRGLLQDVVDGFNRNVPRYEAIKRFAILDHEFTVGDELTPSHKIKRQHCAEKYRAILDGFYGTDRHV